MKGQYSNSFINIEARTKKFKTLKFKKSNGIWIKGTRLERSTAGDFLFIINLS